MRHARILHQQLSTPTVKSSGAQLFARTTRWYGAAMRWTLVPLAASLPLLACSFNFGGGCQDTSCSGSASGSAGDDTTSDTDADSDGLPDFWPGVACPADPDETPRFYFDLRAGKDDDHDFFRLPFPADLRRRGGGLDLDGFPRPPARLAAAPELAAVIDRWMDHLEQDVPGFAVDGAVLFRSSSGVQAVRGIRYINITPGHPKYGESLNGLSYIAENGSVSGNNYICRNWVAVEPSDGVVLDADATYAVMISDESEPLNGGRFTPDADLKLMLQASPPTDSSKLAAWHSFAPLRTFLASPANAGEKRIASAQIVAATVFTTAPHRAVMASARQAVHDGPLAVRDLHVCEAAGDSPCSTAPGLSDAERAARRCGAPAPDFTEIHGRVTVPIFQEGRPPYASHGGKIQVDADGPVLHAVQDVCFALTVPTSQAPDAGFPTLVFAHGTGGSFRDATSGGLAAVAARAGIATLTLEGNLHGQRRGDTDGDGLVDGLPVDQLIFNLRNPDAARDNLLQGAIDQFTAVRLAAHLPEATAPEPPPAPLDPANLFFMGHSQGAQSGVAFLPYEPDIRAAVLSGGGANLLRAILAKTEPKVSLGGQQFPPRDLLQAAFQERPTRPITAVHPLLQLFNIFVNRSDGDVYSPLLRRGADEAAPKHLLMYLGHVDSYTPLRAAASLAIGAKLSVGGSNLFPAPCDRYATDEAKVCNYSISGFMPVTPLPASGNASNATAIVLMREQPAGKDGHHVAFTPTELDRIVTFIDSARDGATPVVAD